MGKINSRRKGANGELEFSHFLKDRGLEARRSQQFSGIGNIAAGDSDIICEPLDAFHWEIKRVELLNINKAMAQAIRDSAKKGTLPIVASRKSHCDWLCTMRADDLITILKELYVKEKNRSEAGNAAVRNDATDSEL